MAAPTVPTTELVLAAMRHAVAIRVAGYRNDERYDRLTLAALRERVVGLPTRPQRRRGGWWAIGRIVDEVADIEWRVWMHPQRRTLKMAPRRVPEPMIPTPTRRPDGRYYDGARRRWVGPADAADGDPGPTLRSDVGGPVAEVAAATTVPGDASDLASRA